MNSPADFNATIPWFNNTQYDLFLFYICFADDQTDTWINMKILLLYSGNTCTTGFLKLLVIIIMQEKVEMELEMFQKG